MIQMKPSSVGREAGLQPLRRLWARLTVTLLILSVRCWVLLTRLRLS